MRNTFEINILDKVHIKHNSVTDKFKFAFAKNKKLFSFLRIDTTQNGIPKTIYSKTKLLSICAEDGSVKYLIENKIKSELINGRTINKLGFCVSEEENDFINEIYLNEEIHLLLGEDLAVYGRMTFFLEETKGVKYLPCKTFARLLIGEINLKECNLSVGYYSTRMENNFRLDCDKGVVTGYFDEVNYGIKFITQPTESKDYETACVFIDNEPCFAIYPLEEKSSTLAFKITDGIITFEYEKNRSIKGYVGRDEILREYPYSFAFEKINKENYLTSLLKTSLSYSATNQIISSLKGKCFIALQENSSIVYRREVDVVKAIHFLTDKCAFDKNKLSVNDNGEFAVLRDDKLNLYSLKDKKYQKTELELNEKFSKVVLSDTFIYLFSDERVRVYDIAKKFEYESLISSCKFDVDYKLDNLYYLRENEVEVYNLQEKERRIYPLSVSENIYNPFFNYKSLIFGDESKLVIKNFVDGDEKEVTLNFCNCEFSKSRNHFVYNGKSGEKVLYKVDKQKGDAIKICDLRLGGEYVFLGEDLIYIEKGKRATLYSFDCDRVNLLLSLQVDSATMLIEEKYFSLSKSSELCLYGE